MQDNNSQEYRALQSKVIKTEQENQQLNDQLEDYQSLLQERYLHSSSLSEKKDAFNLRAFQSSMTNLVKKLDGMQKEQDGLVHANRVLHKDNRLLREQLARIKQENSAITADLNDERHRKMELRCVELEAQNQDNIASLALLQEQLKAAQAKQQDNFQAKNDCLLFLDHLSQPTTTIDKAEILKFLGKYELDLELALEIRRQKEAEELRLRLEEEERLRAQQTKSPEESYSYEEKEQRHLLHQKVQGAYFCSGSQRFSKNAEAIKKRSSVMNQELLKQSSGLLQVQPEKRSKHSSSKKDKKEPKSAQLGRWGNRNKERPTSTYAQRFKR